MPQSLSKEDPRNLREKIIFSLLSNPNFVPINGVSVSGDQYSYNISSHSIVDIAKSIESYISKGDFYQDNTISETIDRLRKEGKLL